MSRIVSLVVTAGLLVAVGELRAETRFTIIDSSPTSWVARGYDNYTVSPVTNWTFSATRNFDNGIGLSISGVALPGTAVTNWSLNFAAPGDAVLVPGVYANFQRFPFQAADRPGLEFGSTGRLDNQAAGTFEVLEATYGPGGEVLSFAANFTHYGETNVNNYAVVEVRYNSVPGPGAGIVGLAGIGVITFRRRR